jgi:glycolate oxidase FAD binding subunit
VEYVPGDLTLTARAGTTLAEIDEVTRAHGQWLPLDPVADRRATLGATIATASVGPLAAAMGRARDVALGIELVTGTGEVIRVGGRVVKNVAGFDLVRLNVGAFGTLGAITEVTVKLSARSRHDATRLIECGESHLAQVLSTLRAASIDPLAVEVIDPQRARRLGTGVETSVLVRTAGNATAAASQRAVLEGLAAKTALPADVWEALMVPEDPGATVLRVSRSTSHFVNIWEWCSALLPSASMQGSPLRGVVRCVVSGADASFVRAAITELETRGATVIVERAHADLWASQPTPPHASLASRLRLAFDPHGVLNRGAAGGVVS